MDYIVTTPKSEMANSAAEAAECIANGGGFYFRKFPPMHRPRGLDIGSKLYYVEDGYIRGFATVEQIVRGDGPFTCETTGKSWGGGWFAVMRADSWKWISPIPYKGFQGWRRIDEAMLKALNNGKPVDIVGGWLDPKPVIAKD